MTTFQRLLKLCSRRRLRCLDLTRASRRRLRTPGVSIFQSQSRFRNCENSSAGATTLLPSTRSITPSTNKNGNELNADYSVERKSEVPISEHEIKGLCLDVSTAFSNSPSMTKLKMAKLNATDDGHLYKSDIDNILSIVSLTKRDLIKSYDLEWRDLRVIYDVTAPDQEGANPNKEPVGARERTRVHRANTTAANTGNTANTGKDAYALSAHRTKYNNPHFFVRKDCFVIHLIEMTALVTATECYLFHTPSVQMQKQFLAMMALLCCDDEDNVRGIVSKSAAISAIQAVQASFDKSEPDARAPDKKRNPKDDVPFEFNCLEAVLKASVVRQRARCDEFRKQTNDIITLLRALTTSSNEVKRNESYDLLYDNDYGMNITKLKSDLATLSSQMEALAAAIKLLVKSDGEMANMCLTWKERLGYKHLPPHSMHDEVEEILENYLWQYQEILYDLKLFSEQLLLHEHEMGLVLDSQRNQIMRINLKLAILTFGIACSGLGTGLAGMNLVSGVEEVPYLFWIATPLLAAIVPFATWRAVVYKLRLLKVLV